MKCAESDLLLYAVTDRAWLGERTLAQVTEQAIRGGATCVQLREKNLDQAAFLAEARELKALCGKYRVPFIVNDDLEVMLASDADGIHVGQSDMEAGDVRAVIGSDKILGVSVQTVEQAILAQHRGADYLGVGAVFPTGSKADAAEVSRETLRAICDAVTIPVVAIGGISAGNVHQLRGTGICGVAVISAIFAAPDIGQAASLLKEKAEEAIL